MGFNYSFSVIFKLLLALLIGVFIGFYFALNIPFYFIIIILSILLIWNIPVLNKNFRKLNSLYGILIFIIFILLGIVLVDSKNYTTKENYFYSDYKSDYLIRVVEPPVLKKKSIKIVADVLQRNDTITVGKTILYVENDSSSQKIKYGDKIWVYTQFNPIESNKNPYEFDYARYLKLHAIAHQGYVKKENFKILSNESNFIFTKTYAIRSYLDRVLDESNLKEKNKMVAKALLLGEKEYLDKDTLKTYSSAGAMHVLAVSGLHVGIVMIILSYLFAPLKKIKYGIKIYIFLILMGIWIYAFVTGLSPSVMRATFMFSFVIFGKEMERETNIYQSIMVSAFILILLDPFVIFKVGFQLSYLAVLGIVFLQSKIYNLFYIKNKIIDYVWKITSVSIAAQIATFPIGLYYFHQFPNFFFISNLVVIPMAGVILIIGILYFMFHWLDWLNEVILFLLDLSLTLMNYAVKWVEELPYSIFWGISITPLETLFIYLAVFFLTLAFMFKKIKMVFVSSILTILILGLFVFRKEKFLSENELIVYNINDELAIDVFYGRDNLFIANQTLLEDESKLLFHVQHYWFHRRNNEEPHSFINYENLPTKFFQMGGKTFFIYDENEDYLPKTDFVILLNTKFISTDKISFWKENQSTCIIHPSNKNSTVKFLKKNLAEEKIYEIKKEGPFIFSF